MPATIVRFDRVTHDYGAVRALDGVSLELAPGQLTALLGPNGAGKTTLIHLLLGVLGLQGGNLSVFGGDPRSRSVRRRTGAMLQISGVQDTLSVGELLDLFASFYPAPMPIAEAMAAAGLQGLYNRRFARLSGGQKQRVMFALAIIGNPELLILDEPTTGLDPSARHALWRAIRAHTDAGGTVLLCTHYMEEADKLADRVVVMHTGRILTEGTPEAIRREVPRRRIRCRTRLDRARLEALPEVRNVTLADGHAELLAGRAEATAAALLAADPELEDLEILGADLETAFLTLTETHPEAA